MQSFWEVFYSHEERKWELVKKSSDDTLFANNVFELQQAGFDVNCQGSDNEIPKSKRLQGYIHEDGLYNKYLNQYEDKTGKHLNKW